LFSNGHAHLGDPMPIGSPRVFQCDHDFIAGYLEMFFRTPHYFAAQNSTLYEAFCILLHQDPREYLPYDFSQYVDHNRAAYAASVDLPPVGITVSPFWWPF